MTPAVRAIIALSLCSACATAAPPPGRPDAPVGVDAAFDAAVGDDAGPLDGGAPLDTGGPLDAGDLPDTPPRDTGPGGPTACTAATAAALCGALPCVDGFCCDGLCTGACRACNVAGAEGTCTMIAAATDPAGECADQAPSTCGTVGTCDGAGTCTFHATGIACDDGAACTTGDSCDGVGTCRGSAPTSCAPAAGNECCVGSCDASAGCATAASACADVCGANELRSGRACAGCGPARAAGLCGGGVVRPCNAASHLLCESATCGGSSYVCTSVLGVWAWRTASACDDSDACTHGDACSGGLCRGTAITCTTTTCMTRTCNGGPTCTDTPRTGTTCDDGDACSYGDACNASGVCSSGMRVTCTSTTCLDRACNGTMACTDTPRTGLSCTDGNACSYGETCSAGGACGGGTTIACDSMDTTCRDFSCAGTAMCTSAPRNVGMTCDDGNAATMGDRCQADGTCLGGVCSPTLAPVFSDNFAAPSSASWTSGTDALVTTSRWRATTRAQHGVRINGGRLEITNKRGSSGPDHGQGYAYVATSGAGAPYDTALYNSTLSANAGQAIVWSLNMRRDNPESTNGGFSCSSTSSQNNITVGVAYVLATDLASGLDASTSTCSSSGASRGYAVVVGGGTTVRLVRFTGGLRNGALTTLLTSSSIGSVSNYLSVRVTYDATTNNWRLEARSDGSSAFADPAAGTYSSTGNAVDATLTSVPLGFSGPYFQTGCTGLCSSTMTALFDNVSVGIRCAP